MTLNETAAVTDWANNSLGVSSEVLAHDHLNLPMEPREYLGTNQAPATADFEALEVKYSFKLPEEYKAHLLQHNGGRIRGGAMFQQPATEDGARPQRRLRNFKSVRYGTSTVEKALENMRDELHDDLVPFASESGGDVFVLSVGPKDYGSIYYLAHEFYTPPEYEYDEETDESTPPAPLDYGSGVHFLAPSFTAFLDGLVAVPDEG